MSKETKPQIKFVHDTFEEYLSSDAISASDCKTVLESPKKWKYQKDNPDDSEEEDHFKIGSALHELILEPHLFKQNYMVIPKLDRRTKEGKAAYAKFLEESEGKVLIKEDDMTMILEMGKNAEHNATFMEFLQDSHREVSCYLEDPETGLMRRIRPDILPKKRNTIIDIKTTTSAHAQKFRRDIYNFGYGLSGAYYLDILERENYIFAAFEKEAPYQMSLFGLGYEFEEYGRRMYRMALDAIKWAKDNDYWCDYTEFEIWKECYQLNDLDSFFDTLERSDLIQIID